MDNSEVIGVLNNLIETCRDGQEGFRSAAENIRNSEFRRLFNIFSQQRAQFVSELRAEVHRLGGDPTSRGSIAGWLQRGWMNLKGAVTRGDEGSIVTECQRGEEAAVNNYREALKKRFAAGCPVRGKAAIHGYQRRV